jgi:hypothetical protein
LCAQFRGGKAPTRRNLGAASLISFMGGRHSVRGGISRGEKVMWMLWRWASFQCFRFFPLAASDAGQSINIRHYFQVSKSWTKIYKLTHGLIISLPRMNRCRRLYLQSPQSAGAGRRTIKKQSDTVSKLPGQLRAVTVFGPHPSREIVQFGQKSYDHVMKSQQVLYIRIHNRFAPRVLIL